MLGGHRPDAGQLVELLDRRRVQVDLAARGRRARAGGRRGRHASLERDDHLLAVGQRRREVDEVERRLRPRAPSLRDRIVDAAPFRQSVEPRSQDGACDVDDELAGRRLLDRERDRLRPRGRLGLAAAEGQATGDREEHEQRCSVGKGVRTRDGRHAHVSAARARSR